MPRMGDDELLNQIELLERQAVGYYTGEVAAEQTKALDYYLGKPYGTEEEGKSQVNSSDVWDVVEGMTPIVLKPFVSSDEVVKFSPSGPDDEERAQQETEYINYVVTQRNDVFEQLVAWVKTGLLQKNGVVKYWWDKSRKTEIERYFGISDDVYTLLLQELPKDVEVMEHTEMPGEPMQDPQTGAVVPGEPSHDLTLRISHEQGEAKYEVVAPEEILVGRDARTVNPKGARFWQHRRRVTISQLREMGYKVEDGIADYQDTDAQLGGVYAARRSSEENESINEQATLDPASREVLFRETFLNVDADGDGIAELRKVCAVGRTLLDNEETEEIPFCSWTPYQQPFKYYGKCPADETCEIQLVKTTVIRQTMDNIYTINNNRNFVSSKVNLDDLLDNQIAGIVRVDGDVVGNHVMPAPITPIGAVTLPIIEYFDAAKENRTGFSRYNQGSSDLNNQKTLGEVQLVSEQSNQRVELVSRGFAETGLRQLMLGIHGLCRRHATKTETVRLRGKWVTVDPRSWKTRYDMTVSVGLGAADKRLQMQGAQMLMGAQGSLAGVPGLVTPENFYNAAAKLTNAIGEKDAEKFFSNPSMQEQPQPPDPTKDPAFQLEAAKVQIQGKQVDLKAKEVAIKDRDSLVKADVAEAEIALQAELQGHDMRLQLMQAMQSLQQQHRDTHAALQDLMLRMQQQGHQQSMDVAGHGLQAQGQQHAQDMAEASHSLAEQQAQQVQESNGQA